MDALEQIKKWRQELHQIPEPGLHEYKTSKYLKTELLKNGISANYYIKDRCPCIY